MKRIMPSCPSWFALDVLWNLRDTVQHDLLWTNPILYHKYSRIIDYVIEYS